MLRVIVICRRILQYNDSQSRVTKLLEGERVVINEMLPDLLVSLGFIHETDRGCAEKKRTDNASLAIPQLRPQ